jgi:hypothetical protein
MPKLITYSVESPGRLQDEDLRVEEVVDQDVKWWNIALLKKYFRRTRQI